MLTVLDEACTRRGSGGLVDELLRDLVAEKLVSHLAAPAAAEAAAALQLLESVRDFAAQVNPGCRTESAYAASRSVLAAVAGSGTNLTRSAMLLGVDRRAMYVAGADRRAIDQRGWAAVPLRRRLNGGVRNAHSAVTRKRCYDFWTENSRESPLARDKAVEWSEYGIPQTPHAVYLQDRSDREMHEAYCAAYPQHPVSLACFKSVGNCKPPWVKRLKQRFVCLSTRDENHRLFVDAVRAMAAEAARVARASGAKGCACKAGAIGCAYNCGNSAGPFAHPGRLRNAVMCAKADGAAYHLPVCIDGTCLKCGWKRKLGRCKLLYTDAVGATWQQFLSVKQAAIGTSEERTRLVLTDQSGTRRQLMEEAEASTAAWLPFDFVGRWQMASIKRHVETLPPGTLLVSTDYAADFNVEPLQHLQAESMQGVDHIKILVVVTWRHAADSTPDAPHVLQEEHFFMYDDGRGFRAHWTVVQHALAELKRLHDAAGSGITRIVVCSDNCAAQFKSCTAFLGMLTLQKDWNYTVPLAWLYGGAERFKWVHDGAGGWLKSVLRRELSTYAGQRKITDAATAAAFLTSRQRAGAVPSTSVKRDSERVVQARTFHLVPLAVLTSSATKAEKSVPGTRSMHALRFSADRPGVMFWRERGCGCAACVRGDYTEGACENSDYTGPWQEAEVNAAAESSQGDDDEEDAPEDIAVGDIVAVAASIDDGALPFWLLKVTKAPYRLDKALSNDGYKDDSGKALRYKRGTRVLHGNWVQQSEDVPEGFELWDEEWVRRGVWASGAKPWKNVPVVVIEAEYIVATKVEMQPADAALRQRMLANPHTGACLTLPPASMERLEALFCGR